MIDQTNRAVASILNCDQEPIHIPGSIQPHGYLLALSSQSGVITHGSANLPELFQLPLQAILGESISRILPEHQSVLSSCLTHGDDFWTKSFPLKIGEGNYHLTAHRSQDRTILELETLRDNASEIISVPALLDLIKTPGSIPALCQAVAVQLQKMLGYDRVMIYRFDPENHTGEVVSEAVVADQEPYLGLWYPAGDIPPQARALYLLNPIRSINDTHYEPVALFAHTGENQGTPDQLDLSHAYLRSVSPIHIQYLKNMGVGASLSISIIKDGRLWGLIACHHGKAHHLTIEQRHAAQMTGLLLSSQIDVYEKRDQSAALLMMEERLNRLLKLFDREDEFSLGTLAKHRDLLAVPEASGVAIVVDREIYTNGLTPTTEQILDLAEFLLQSPQASEGFWTKNLTGVYPAATEFEAQASGIIYQKLSHSTHDYILWFRAGLVQTVNWGGKPNDAKAADSPEKLSPRSSFSAWQETVRDISAPWLPAQVQGAERLAFALRKQLRAVHLQLEANRQQALNERLKAVNEELENINWISTHDLREPLRKIQILASRVLSKESQDLTDTLLYSIGRMHSSAQRMQQLLDDIAAYSFVSGSEDLVSEVSLEAILAQIAYDKEDTIKELGVQLCYGNLPTLSGIDFQLKQLFVNLINNSLKFGRPDERLVVSVEMESAADNVAEELGILPQNYLAIVVRDNGVGFEKEYRNTIFKLFQRLNNETTGQTGTGIGLAICKKVMLNHDGYIWADSTLNEGSEFHLLFPKSRIVES